jgi:hypothetical protein
MKKLPKVIGFAGRAGAGKNTAAEVVASDAGGIVIGFADPLYQAVAAAVGVPEEVLRDRATKEVPLPIGRSPRHLLQTLGTEWGREHVRPDLWVYRARQRIEEAGMAGVPIVAICDVRFPNEVELVRELGGEIWWIDRPDLDAGDHVSERQLVPNNCDRIVFNGEDANTFRRRVRDAWLQFTATLQEPTR